MLLSHLFEAQVALDAALSGMEAARRHPDAFIHFTNVPKLGINPSRLHKDAPGIYFYPCRWLTNPENFSEFQYGLSMPYYFVATPVPGARIVRLDQMTMAQARKLATEGGWREEFDRFAADPESLTREGVVTSNRQTRRKAGFLWYGGMDHLTNVAKTHSWIAMLRGVDGIHDPGFGIIHPDEPMQLIAMRRNVMRVVEHGGNTDASHKVRGRAMAEAARRLGGTAGWREGFPFLRATVDGKPVEVEDRVGEDWTYSFRNGVWTPEVHRSRYESDEAGLIERYLRSARTTARGAAAEGRVSRWTPAAMGRLARMFLTSHHLRPLATVHHDKPLVPEGELRYSAGAGSSGTTFATFDVGADDSLRFSFQTRARNEESPLHDFRYERSFAPGATDREIASAIVAELPDALMQRFKHLPPTLEDGRDRRDLVLQMLGIAA